MNQLGPFLALIGLAALALAGLGAIIGWYNQGGRRIRRGLKVVLGETPHALIVAAQGGRGAGFNFGTNLMAVTWDLGSWCLVYKIDELVGVELIIDGQVAARSHRGEARRPLDVLGGAERDVVLRLVFDDPHHPDFKLDLWSAAALPAISATTAVEEGNRWIARMESLFRRNPSSSRTHAPAAGGPLTAGSRPQFRPLAGGEDLGDAPLAAAAPQLCEPEDDEAESPAPAFPPFARAAGPAEPLADAAPPALGAPRFRPLPFGDDEDEEAPPWEEPAAASKNARR